MPNIKCIKNTRHLLTQEATETLVLGTVISHLDYCNSILVGLPEVDITKMQHIQNIAAKMVVLNDVAMKDSNPRSILEKLHWLPICRRIQYKILTLIHVSIMWSFRIFSQTPNRISVCREETGTKKSNLERRLVEPKTMLKTFAARSFSCVGPKWWNLLPNALKTIESTQEFRNKLKTYLFREQYKSWNMCHSTVL